ncbi:hypothetical protein, partial [Streptococcus dysgalactiae]|uniref:hypothetical protein n=1 Tax=Streptococcus dysgalactiae TaxID=1334 RepID=UPI00194F6298
DFQVGIFNFYVGNRRLTAVEEKQMFNLMGMFRRSREIREYAERNFDRRLTLNDVNSIRTRLYRYDNRNEAMRVRDMLRGRGRLEVKMEKDLVKFVFFAPSTIDKETHSHTEVILADATHQLNCGAYV